MGVGKRATKYAQGVFYRSLSRAVTGVNREIVKQFFQLCGISVEGLAVPIEHLRGILGYNGGLEVILLYNDAFEDEAGDEFDRE